MADLSVGCGVGLYSSRDGSRLDNIQLVPIATSLYTGQPICYSTVRPGAARDVRALQDLVSPTRLRARLTRLIESAYADVRMKLLREVRIFTGSNAAAMALLGIVMLLRRRAGLQLMLPAAAALVEAVPC